MSRGCREKQPRPALLGPAGRRKHGDPRGRLRARRRGKRQAARFRAALGATRTKQLRQRRSFGSEKQPCFEAGNPRSLCHRHPRERWQWPTSKARATALPLSPPVDPVRAAFPVSAETTGSSRCVKPASVPRACGVDAEIKSAVCPEHSVSEGRLVLICFPLPKLLCLRLTPGDVHSNVPSMAHR